MKKRIAKFAAFSIFGLFLACSNFKPSSEQRFRSKSIRFIYDSADGKEVFRLLIISWLIACSPAAIMMLGSLLARISAE